MSCGCRSKPLPAGVVEGKCHLCREEHALIMYCKACDHWMCGVCRKKWFNRGLAALKEVLGGRQEGCCGPIA